MPKPEGAPPFTGFVTPYFTQIPNEVFDNLLADLSGAEWKVLAYIMRKTYGWHKTEDDIGLRQLTDGIPGVDRGTGLSKSTVALALKSLEEWGLIERQQNRDAERGDLPTTYRVRLSDTGRVENRTPPAPEIGHPRVPPSDTQKTSPVNTSQKKDGSTQVEQNGETSADRLARLRSAVRPSGVGRR